MGERGRTEMEGIGITERAKVNGRYIGGRKKAEGICILGRH
jgi:hypothetical protein